MTRYSREWLETMLSYATNLLSQAWDIIDESEITPTTGPEGDPDRYDIRGFLAEVRKRYPEF